MKKTNSKKKTPQRMERSEPIKSKLKSKNAEEKFWLDLMERNLAKYDWEADVFNLGL